MSKTISAGHWHSKGANRSFQVIQMDNGKNYTFNGSEAEAKKIKRWQYFEQDQFCRPSEDMTILEAFRHIIKNEPHEGRSRLWIDNKEAADTISQFIMDNGGNGSTYGKFVNSDVCNGEWYEVDYELN